MTGTHEPVAIVGAGLVSVAGCGASTGFDFARSGGQAPRAAQTIVTELGARYPVFEVPESAMGSATCGGSRRLPGGRGRRGTRLALLAADEAWQQAHSRVPGNRVGVIAGATVGGMMHTEDWIESRTESPGQRVAGRAAIRHLPLWEAPRRVADQIGATGPVTAVTTACTSGTLAIASAADLIATGVCDVVVAGGVDALARLTFHGFASLGLLDQHRCRPFHPDRAGLNLGEAAAFVVLASARLADGLVRPPLAWLEGWAMTADAHHATAPRPDGSGLAAAIRGALDLGGLPPSSVDWVHAHGTGTRTNDDVEAVAIRTVFGPEGPLVSSTKHVFGHTLGAAGAVSTVLAVEAIRNGFVPGNVLADASVDDLRLAPPAGVERDVRRVVVSSMGFGGACCALAVGRDRS